MVDLTVFGWICCPDCGDSVSPEAQEDGSHDCEEHRHGLYQEALLLRGISRFERDLSAWLATPQGRFARFLAARR